MTSYFLCTFLFSPLGGNVYPIPKKTGTNSTFNSTVKSHGWKKNKQQNVKNINLLSSETVRFIAFRWAVIMKHIQHCFALETPCKSRPSLCPLHMKKSTVWFGFLMRWQGVFKVWLYWLAVNGSLVPSCHGSKNADGRCKIQIGRKPNMRQGLERRERTKVGIKSRTTEGLKKD